MSLETIAQFAVGEESTKNAYGVLAREAGNFSSVDIFDGACRASEEAYMEAFYMDDPAARKGNGEWKFRTYLPKAYSSSKSVLRNALLYGINITDGNGIPLGKSALEKAIKAKKDGDKPEKTPDEKALSALNMLTSCWHELEESTRAIIRDTLGV